MMLIAVLAVAAWISSERSYSRVIAEASTAPDLIQRIPDYWGRPEVPRDELETLNEQWKAEMKWPVRMLLGPDQLLVVEGTIFEPGDTLEFAYDSGLGGVTVNGVLPLRSDTPNPARQMGRTADRKDAESSARGEVCFYKNRIESGQGFIEFKKRSSSSSRSATRSDVAEALNLLELSRTGTLSDRQWARARELGFNEAVVAEVAERNALKRN